MTNEEKREYRLVEVYSIIANREEKIEELQREVERLKGEIRSETEMELSAMEPTHRHVKTGHLVREIGRGYAQVSAHPIEEMTAVSIYEHNGRLWVRNAVEFDDGRFAALGREGEGE